MKNIGVVGHIGFGKTTTTELVEAVMKMDKTVVVVGENAVPQFDNLKSIKIKPHPPLAELTMVDYGSQNISSRAARRKKERDSKKRKRK
jgi:hypothetical protein